jgi:hypothetical protein
MAAAQAAAARRLAAIRAADPDLDPDMARGLSFAFLVKALARHAVTACAEVTMAGLTLDTADALAAARELGAGGWAAAELLLALRTGMAEGGTERRASTPAA